MTEQELRLEIRKKFLSILKKLTKFIIEDVAKNASPQFRYLISGCMEAMERSHLNFNMDEQQRLTYNNIFEQIGSNCRINQCFGNWVDSSVSYKTDIEYLSQLYTVFEQIDNFLSAVEETKQFFTIINKTEPLFSTIGINQNYKDEAKHE